MDIESVFSGGDVQMMGMDGVTAVEDILARPVKLQHL